MAPQGSWVAPLPHGRSASARQRPDGVVEITAASEADVELARFMLALDDDTAEFHERFAATSCWARCAGRSSGTARYEPRPSRTPR